MPYNKPHTNLASLSRTGEYWPSVVLYVHLVRTATTLGQHSLVRLSRLVSKYGLLTKCEVQMAGYWLSAFFASLWTETKSKSINSQKRTRPISSHLDQANLVNKGFIIWLSVKFCLRDTVGSPEQARWLHHSARFRSSCPLVELAI